MIEMEKVIKELDEHIEAALTVDSDYVDCVRTDLLQCTVALLKEQEPLEPLRVEIEQAGPLYHRCYCKKCGHHVGNMIKNKVTEAHEIFCSKCGQAVKW